MGKSKKGSWVWFRTGDIGGYTCADCIEDAAEAFRELSISGPVSFRVDGMGFDAPGWDGHDYISLYWGDYDAEPKRGLSEDEQAEFSRLMSE